MSDIKNLIYNADLSRGADGWNSGANISNGIISITGSLSNSVYIPVNNDDIYKLSFDLKFTSKDSNSFYIALLPLDSSKGFISINTTNKSASNTETTLATQLKNGDTTVTLTNGTNWYNGGTEYMRQIGICNNLAWGYSRSIYNQKYSSKNGNVLTLTSAWSGGTFDAGTKVANFSDGGWAYYPYYIGNSNIPLDWTHVEVTFRGGNSIRFSTAYIQFSTLGYNHTYQMKNLRLENTTSYQIQELNSSAKMSINKNGIFKGLLFGNIGMNIRYIKDYINGSNANMLNHWVEIKALDMSGVNLAYNKPSKVGNEPYTKTCITDGSTSSYSYADPGYVNTVIVDLGFITKISKIQVWHYWADNRIYNDHEISVSSDGINWITVYKGTRPETSDGLTVILQPNKCIKYKTGYIDAKDIIEY